MRSGDGLASIRQRRPKPMCQRSSSSTWYTPSRTPGMRAVLEVLEQRASARRASTIPSRVMW